MTTKMTKNDFLSPSEVSGPFPVDGLGDVYVHQIAFGRATKIYADTASEGGGREETLAKLIVAGVHDKDGEPVFSLDDLPALLATPVAKVRPLIDLVTEHAGVDSIDVDDAVGN